MCSRLLTDGLMVRNVTWLKGKSSEEPADGEGKASSEAGANESSAEEESSEEEVGSEGTGWLQVMLGAHRPTSYLGAPCSAAFRR